MDKRSFIKRLGCFVVGCYLAIGYEPIKEEKDTTCQPNPEYFEAKFKVRFLCSSDAYRSICVGPPPNLH